MMTASAAQTSDLELLSAYAQSRDAQAFAELVRRYAGMVYGTALRVTGSDADAQDVSQECFLTLASQGRRGPITASLPGWLHAQARSRAIDALRRAAARRRHEQRLPAVEQHPSLGEWERIQPHVDAAIAALPDGLRALVTRHYLCGVAQTELVAATGLSQPTISRRLAEAVEQLRSLLKRSGVTLSAAALADGLLQHGQTPVPASLTAALGKMALAGVGAAGTGIATKLTIAIVVVLAIATAWPLVLRKRPAAAPKETTMATVTLAPQPQSPDFGPLQNFAIRIVNIPPLKMARSGSSDLMEFNKWWSAVSAADKHTITPRDFMWGSPKTGKDEWVYALPPGVDQTGGYDTLDFRGGLYAVTSCREPDIGQAYNFATNWVRQSGIFDLDEKTLDRYSMAHVITPQVVTQRLGYNQMDLFVPVILKPNTAGNGDLLKSSFAIRIIQIPPLKMARSGNADHGQFQKWMESVEATDKHSTTPRGFMWYNPQTRQEEWIYALPQGVEDTGGFETLDFPGGLYAVSCCRESELGEAGTYVRDLIRQSGIFALDAATPDRYDMCYIVNPQPVGQALGFAQMDFFIPIALQWPATAALPTPDPNRYDGMWFPRNEPAPAVLRGLVDILHEDMALTWVEPRFGRAVNPIHVAFTAMTGDAFMHQWFTTVPRNPNVPPELYLPDPSPMYKRALAAAGVSCQVFASPRPPEADAELRPLNVPDLQDRILACLVDRKMPVIVGGIPEANQLMLVTGFEDGGDTLVGWSAEGGQDGITFKPADQKKAADWKRQVHFVVIPTGRLPRPSEREVVVQTLVEVERQMRQNQIGLVRTGTAFFDAWADAMEAGDTPPLSMFDPTSAALEQRRRWLVAPTAWDVDERTIYAAIYLQRAKDIFPEAADELAAARASIMEVSAAANHIYAGMGMGLAPGDPPPPAGTGMDEPEKRKQAASLIRGCKPKWTEAADHLQAALAKMR